MNKNNFLTADGATVYVREVTADWSRRGITMSHPLPEVLLPYTEILDNIDAGVALYDRKGNYLFVKLKMIAVSNADTAIFSCRSFDYCRSFVCAIFFIPKKITGSIADFTKIT